MKPKSVYLITMLLLLLFLTGRSAAIEIDFSNDHSSIRCTDGLVHVGDEQQEVLNRCGDPVAITPEDSDSYNVWLYQFGIAKFMYYLGFLDGKLERIVSRPCINNDPNCYDAR